MHVGLITLSVHVHRNTHIGNELLDLLIVNRLIIGKPMPATTHMIIVYQARGGVSGHVGS